MSTRGAQRCVRKMPTGLPDCTSSVSSCSSDRSERTIASNAGQLRAARPDPPYTTRSSGRSATSGSRLFISIRSAASCGQPLQESACRRGARIVRVVAVDIDARNDDAGQSGRGHSKERCCECQHNTPHASVPFARALEIAPDVISDAMRRDVRRRRAIGVEEWHVAGGRPHGCARAPARWPAAPAGRCPGRRRAARSRPLRWRARRRGRP